jgi:hypothetical protein
MLGYSSVIADLVIVRDLDIKSVAIFPYEANPELIINPNAELAFAICLQSLQTVAGRNSKVI